MTTPHTRRSKKAPPDQAKKRGEDASVAPVQTRADVERLIRQLRDANERLAAATMHAHTMAEEAIQREEAYRRLSARLLYLQDEERRRFAADLTTPWGNASRPWS